MSRSIESATNRFVSLFCVDWWYFQKHFFTNEDTIRVAWGSYGISGTNCTEDVIQALKVGYRHLDMASYYRNEKDIALGINRYGIPREKLYLVTKLSPFDMKTEEEVYKACVNSLKNLGIDYLDMYLCHWPGGAGDESPKELRAKHVSVWRGFERLYNEGKVRAIGVANFTVDHLKHLFSICDVRPRVNQVEFHPFLFQRELLDFCKDNEILLEVFGSLGGH
eukprot:185988_1